MSEKVETIVALKSDEQASLSPGAYQVLTDAVRSAGASEPELVAALRSYRQACPDGVMVYVSRQACEEGASKIETLSTSLAHWRLFAEHAEGERSRLQRQVMLMSHELARLRHD
jgi:hypothetical protein